MAIAFAGPATLANADRPSGPDQRGTGKRGQYVYWITFPYPTDEQLPSLTAPDSLTRQEFQDIILQTHTDCSSTAGSHRTPRREPGTEQTRPPTVVPSSTRAATEHGGSQVQNKPARPQFALARRGKPQNATAGARYRTNPPRPTVFPSSTRAATEHHGGSQVQNKPSRPLVALARFRQRQNATAGARSRGPSRRGPSCMPQVCSARGRERGRQIGEPARPPY